MRAIFLVAAVATLAAPASAQDVKASRPQALKRLTDCRSITDQTARLACYDREVAAVDAAEARKDLVVVDREQLRKTRRTLFGLTLPDLSIFGDDSPDEEGMSRIESRIRRLAQDPYGKWIFELEDGARWIQTDTRALSIRPQPGQPIVIRKAAMGSYLANVNKQNAIRMKRAR